MSLNVFRDTREYLCSVPLIEYVRSCTYEVTDRLYGCIWRRSYCRSASKSRNYPRHDGMVPANRNYRANISPSKPCSTSLYFPSVLSNPEKSIAGYSLSHRSSQENKPTSLLFQPYWPCHLWNSTGIIFLSIICFLQHFCYVPAISDESLGGYCPCLTLTNCVCI